MNMKACSLAEQSFQQRQPEQLVRVERHLSPAGRQPDLVPVRRRPEQVLEYLFRQAQALPERRADLSAAAFPQPHLWLEQLPTAFRQPAVKQNYWNYPLAMVSWCGSPKRRAKRSRQAATRRFQFFFSFKQSAKRGF